MDTKERLLQAAGELVVSGGSRTLTLDAVAARAGVSKGGLLYHYPTKKALIAGMVGQAIEAFEGAVARAHASGQDWLEAYVAASLADLTAGDPVSGILAAAAEEPDLLTPFREALGRWYARAEADYGPGAIPLLLALDGLWIHSRLGTLPELSLDRLAGDLNSTARRLRP